MGVGSRVNPNFPIPGLDQSSKGFRDNFAIIKKEIELIQATTIQLSGGVISDAYEIGDSGSLTIHTYINGGDFQIAPPNYAVQFNLDGSLTGDERFNYNIDTGAVGIATTSPADGYHLDVGGQAKVIGQVLIDGNGSTTVPNLLLRCVDQSIGLNTSAGVLLDSQQMSIVTSTELPIKFSTNLEERVIISSDGKVGIGTMGPEAALHVIATTSDLAYLESDIASNDSMIRAVTTASDSSIGWGLQHSASNWVGGMRLDSQGRLTLHTGENNEADLSTSTSRLIIDSAGNIGIGTLTPQYNLEVAGNFKSIGIRDDSTSEKLVIGNDGFVGINKDDPLYQLDVGGAVAVRDAIVFSYDGGFLVDTTPMVIDAFAISDIRSARYTVQIRRGTAPSEVINIIDYVVMHVNGTAVGTEFNNFTNSGNLGTLSVQITGADVELIYTGNAAGNIVRTSKIYIVN